MNQAEFDENFASLTPAQNRVLMLFMAEKSDQEIAKALGDIKDATIRKHIQDICNKMGIEAPSKSARRLQLFALVTQYKPELRGNSTPTVVNPPEELPTEADELDCVEEAETFNREFLGRGPAIAELDELLRNGAKAVLIWAGGGIGKTTLAREFFKARGFELVLELRMARETEGITPVESVVEDWFTNDLQAESGREFGLSLRRLKDYLKTHRIGIFIDNLEPALDNGLFIEPHRQYVELLRVLTDPTVQSVTLITSRERLCESALSSEFFKLLHLQGLDKQAWKQYFASRKMAIDPLVLEQMRDAYGGNAKAMEILWGAIRDPEYRGDMAAYWRDNDKDLLGERELEDLVTRQFKRLEGQNPQAYRLLCRMGCFRYQDVPRVPIEALLCLLWDAPENPRRIVRALRDRALIECEKGEYWLHPVIRAEAIARLRSGEDWEEANRKSAKYWLNITQEIRTPSEAIKVFEAFHHYYNNADWQQCYEIFDIPINLGGSYKFLRHHLRFWGCSHYLLENLTKMQSKLPPEQELDRVSGVAVCFYFISEYKTSINYFKQTLPHLDTNSRRYCRTLSYIAEAYQKLGKLKCALSYSERALNILDKLQQSLASNDFKISEAKAICLNIIGFSYLYKGEGDLALKYHIQAFQIANAGKNHREKGDALAYLSLCYSKIDPRKKAAIQICKNSILLFCKMEDRLSESFARCWLAKLYAHHGKLNLAEDIIEPVDKIYRQMNNPSLTSEILEVKAEIYRKGDCLKAVSYHLKAIKILDNIGAKCDLAEAYYQLGLTYQQMGETEKSETNFQEAIRLFTEIEAPKQVEKVRKAIEKVGYSRYFLIPDG
ncbi:tetratricopeptide repeat protein [Laspinema sp. D1]|uniref:Tetratricopeptide repeat protein n=1 Tax=Laspinema palackyanum D2a TaxID=2953684 RepID=A0ABT2MNV4_9CYAN|nr:tetratricopeptide repeat protein [Laspinema sp. D2a]